MTGRGINPKDFVEAALALLAGNTDASRRRVAKMARQARTAGKMRSQVVDGAHDFRTDLEGLPPAHLQYAYFIPPKLYSGPASAAGYAARALSRRGDERIVSALERELALSHETHGEDLRRLRAFSPPLYDLIVRGKPRAALELAMELSDEAVSLASPIVATHLMFLCVATGHLRVAMLKSTVIAPLGQGFAGRTKWLTMGQVSKAALTEPAAVVQKLLALRLTDSMTDAEAVAKAQDAGLLPDDASTHEVISIAECVRACMPEHSLTNECVRQATRLVQQTTKPLASLKADDLKRAGWSRRTFAEEQFGVSSSEGAVIVAMNLTRVRERVNACVNAILNKQALPCFETDPNSPRLSNNALARLTEALRIEGQSDKNAPPEPGDNENRNSKQLVMKLRKKVDNRQVDKALEHLRVDPAVFFRR